MREQIITEREIEILKLICEGLSDIEIAEKLIISPATVKTHVGNLLNKSGMHNRINLILWAFRNNKVPYPNTVVG